MFNIQYSHSILVFNSHSILTLIVIFNSHPHSIVIQYSHSIPVVVFNSIQYSHSKQSFNTHIQQWYSTATEDLQPRLSLTKTVHVFTLSIVLVLTQFNTKFMENLLNWCVVLDTDDLHSQGSLTRPNTCSLSNMFITVLLRVSAPGRQEEPLPIFSKITKSL